MNKIALFVLYNHHFTKNIDRIDELYKGKFTYVYHLIPFYNGDKENVITVYESSYQFQSYIAQAYQQVKKEGFTHYFVVADDMIINPQINENNLFEFTGIPEDSAFITDIRDARSNLYDIPLYHYLDKPGIEVIKILPPKEEALKRLKQAGLNVMADNRLLLKYLVHYIIKLNINRCKYAFSYFKNRSLSHSYPAVWAYSDILLLPMEGMGDFATYSGALAGLNIFVENAIPLALYLSYNNIILGNQLKLYNISQLYNLGEKGEKEFLEKYNYSLKTLLDHYPENYFFIHPIKLSRWK